MQRAKMKSAFWLGIAAFALSIGLIGEKEVQANVNTLTKPQNLMGDSQTPTIKKVKGLDHSPMLISQAAGPYDGRWFVRLVLVQDNCGIAPLGQAITFLNVQTSGESVVIRDEGLGGIYTGKLYTDGVKATVTIPPTPNDAFNVSTINSWYILNRNGNSAQAYLQTLIPNYGCGTLLRGEATFQSP
jgi:hypothetical protein